MKKVKKISLWIAGVLVFLMVLVSVFLVVLPRFINIDPVREKILAKLSREAGGQVTYQKVDLSFLPLPRVVIHGVELAIPGKTRGTIKTATVYPNIWGLILGRVELYGLELENPDFRVELPEAALRKREGSEKALLSATPLSLDLPVEDLELVQGKLEVLRAGKRLFLFENMEARLQSKGKGVGVVLSCVSNVVERISLKGRFDPKTFKGNGQVELTRLKPHLFTEAFIPDKDFRLGRSLANLKLSITGDGPRAIEGKFRGSIPQLLLERKERQLAIAAGDFTGTFQRDDARTEISLQGLALRDPRITMGATLVLNRTAPRILLKVEGRQVDISSTRKAALGIAGDDSTVQEIFEIVRAGQVPAITFATKGDTGDDLADLGNMVIKAHIDGGRIQVPGVDMDLGQVAGDAVISRGVLRGENLGAQYGSTLGREGKLELGLVGEDAPFHLDILLDADLATLPPFLKRVLADRAFKKELDLITALSGKATGRLVLGDHLNAVTPWVEASPFTLSAKYQRLPFRVTVKGGRFVYDPAGIRLDKVRADLGKSSVSGISGRVSLGKTPGMDITCSGSRINLEEIFPWLKTRQWWQVRSEGMKSLEGLLISSGAHVRGRLLSPKKWHFDVSGKMQDIILDSALIPGPVKIPQGNYRVVQEAAHQELSVEATQIEVLEASYQVSGMLPDYLKGLNRAEISVQGTAGKKVIGYLGDRLKVPPHLRLKAPISLTGGRLSWERGKQTAFSGDAIVHQGPHVSIDLVDRAGELIIKDLRIQDDASRASMGLDLKKDMLGVRFSGHLEKETLNGLFVDQHIPWGKIKGDIQAQISLNHLLNSKARGNLKGNDLITRWGLMKAPVLIDNISLKAEGRHIDVQSAGLRYQDHEMMIKGGMDFSDTGLKLDLDARTGDLAWDDLAPLMKEKEPEKTETGKERSPQMKVEGVVRFQAESFKYGRFVWRPLHADVFLDSEGVRIDVKTADLCGISTPGTLTAKGEEISLDFKGIAENLPVKPAADCFLGDQVRGTGTIDLQAQVRGNGTPDQLVQALEGTLNYDARDGRIYRDILFTQILNFLNITEILRGHFPDIGEEGFAYNSIAVRSRIKDGKILVQQGTMDAEPAHVAFEGSVDLKTGNLDLTVLVSPVKTANWIIRHIPLVNRIMGGSLITIPVKVTGPPDKVKVTPIPTTAVGGGLTNMMKNIVELPFHLIPVNPSEEKK